MPIIKIQKEDFSVEAEIKKMYLNKSGAVVSFIGLVRDFNNENLLSSLSLECYTAMAYKEINSIVQQAITKFHLTDVTVIHRIGVIYAHEQIVLVVAASQHRKQAFLGCEYIINYLKLKAPFFKQEIDITNKATWVKPNDHK